MITLYDDDTYLTAGTRREMLDKVLALLPEEPEVWQVYKIGAACLGHREAMAVTVIEEPQE